MHIACLVTYKERNGYWFSVCVFYMNFTALRHTCHINAIILCIETWIAQLLQLLGYVMCSRGPRVQFCLCKGLSYTTRKPALGSTNTPNKLVSGALSMG